MGAGSQWNLTDLDRVQELFHESCFDYPSCKVFPAACVRKRVRNEEGK
jgi:hypothetical protein